MARLQKIAQIERYHPQYISMIISGEMTPV